MLSIVEVQAADYIESILDVLSQNWAETGFDFEFAPSVAIYKAMQDAGLMFALACFDDDGYLIGYSTAAVTAHPLNPAIVCCSSDALFVRPEYRSTSAGARLIAATERIGKARGATRMLWHTRAGTPMAAMMEKRGYIPADVVVMKRI